MIQKLVVALAVIMSVVSAQAVTGRNKADLDRVVSAANKEVKEKFKKLFDARGEMTISQNSEADKSLRADFRSLANSTQANENQLINAIEKDRKALETLSALKAAAKEVAAKEKDSSLSADEKAELASVKETIRLGVQIIAEAGVERLDMNTDSGQAVAKLVEIMPDIMTYSAADRAEFNSRMSKMMAGVSGSVTISKAAEKVLSKEELQKILGCSRK